MKRSSSPTKSEFTEYLQRFIQSELEERFVGRKVSEINDHEVVDIIQKVLENLPIDTDWRWARREGKKLGVSAAQLLTMRWSEANALAVKRGLSWAITPKQPPAKAPASGSRGASRRKPSSADRRG